MSAEKKLHTSEKKASVSKETEAMHSLFEELFADMYQHRRRLYRLNFIRGIFYGSGTALGGTVVLAVIFWILSWFVDWPYIGQFIERVMAQ